MEAIVAPEWNVDPYLKKQEFIRLLKRLRGGVTQVAFAETLGISATYLCDVERGRKNPSIRFVQRLCDHDGANRLEWHRAAARACGWEV